MTGQVPWGQGCKGPWILAAGLGLVKGQVVSGGAKGQYFSLAHGNSLSCHGSGRAVRDVISHGREMGSFDSPQDEGSHLVRCGRRRRILAPVDLCS